MAAFTDCNRKDQDNFKRCPITAREKYLYNLPHNYVDLSVEENGLWAVYHYEQQDYLVVSKLELSDMHIVHTWNLTTTTANITTIAESFIMCGVLYGIESVEDTDSYITFAYDLYEEEEIEIDDIPWKNPMGKTSMVQYNPNDRRIYFFNNGKLLSAPVRVSNLQK